MAAEGGAVRQILWVIDGSRGKSGSQDKAVINVNRGMFFEAVMRLIVFNDPIRFEISWELERFAVFIEFTFRSISFISMFFNLIIADGMAGRFNEPGIDSDAFINGKALTFKLAED